MQQWILKSRNKSNKLKYRAAMRAKDAFPPTLEHCIESPNIFHTKKNENLITVPHYICEIKSNPNLS